ncbi:hypothetical protein Sarmat_01012 [Rickettsiales endosymbiont of Paramecium tredecaurelia]|nr:hypothetical protein [Candidatus Sarmatiella mevalonica]
MICRRKYQQVIQSHQGILIQSSMEEQRQFQEQPHLGMQQSQQMQSQNNRPLSKLTHDEQMQGSYKAQSRSVHEVREDSSIDSVATVAIRSRVRKEV